MLQAHIHGVRGLDIGYDNRAGLHLTDGLEKGQVIVPRLRNEDRE